MKCSLAYILFLLLLSCTSSTTPQEEIKTVSTIHNKIDQDRDSNMLRGINDALKDIKNEKSKYYDCNADDIEKDVVEAISKDYNIQIVNKNCIIGNYEVGYNHIIDSVLIHYYGVTMKDIMTQ